MRSKTPSRLFQCALLALALGAYVGSCGGVGHAPSGSAFRALVRGDDGIVARPGVEEELWVISRSGAAVSEQSDAPHSGCILAHLAAEPQREVPVPLAHTDVQAEISGFVATVDVRQTFQNPFDQKIEAVYSFPLPQNAAVHEFVMQIGERRIRGIIREREEAERAYLEARRQGYIASLLVQDRPNVFTQSVANIEPGRSIDIDIRYIHTLSHHDGWFEYRFPMVVAPRYNPPASTDGIAAVSFSDRGTSAQKTEVSYLKPSERSGHDISLSVRLATGIAMEELHSPTHAVDIQPVDANTMDIVLREHDSIPNRDFVLRYRLGGGRVRAALMTSTSGSDGYFSMLIMPPEGLQQLPRRALDLVFVVDRSGSMDGASMNLARRAVQRSLAYLSADDRFNIHSFAKDVTSFRHGSVQASEENLEQGLRFLEGLRADGGTEMLGALQAVLDEPADLERQRCIVFLTDGHVGNEAEVLSLLGRDLGSARVFSFAIGSASNQYLAESMARIGRGAVAFIGQGDDPNTVMHAFLERVSHPALEDLVIDWSGLEVSDVQPARLPDLYSGRPLIVSGRFRGQVPSTIRLTGSVDGRPSSASLDAVLDTPSQPGIAFVWARRKLAELTDEALVHRRFKDSAWRAEVTRLALLHGLMSDFTAFLAVDSSQRTAGDHGIQVPVPVPVPEGVRYETAVGR